MFDLRAPRRHEICRHFLIGVFSAHVTPNGSFNWPYRSPQNTGGRHGGSAARIDGTSVPGVDVIDREHDVECGRRLQRMAMFRISIAKHDRSAVDIDMGMHRAALRIRRMNRCDFGRECLLVEFSRLDGAVDRQIGDRAAFHRRIRHFRIVGHVNLLLSSFRFPLSLTLAKNSKG
jgi:hypothetical protein